MHQAIQSTHDFVPARDLKHLTIAMNDEYEGIFTLYYSALNSI